jgi:hypothetical protein
MSSDINVQSFSGKVNITSNLLVGSSHLFVDTTNNRVGLVTNNPDSGLHVNSNAYVNTDFRVGSDIVMNEVAGRITADSFVGNGSGLTSISSDSGSWVNGSSSNVHLAVSTDNVGIGIDNPAHKLDVNGDINISTGSTLKVGGTPVVFSNWTKDATTNELTYNSGNVGINNFGDNPRTLLHLGKRVASSAEYSSFNTIPSAGMGITADFPRGTHIWAGNSAGNNEEYWGLAIGTMWDGKSYLQNLDKSNSTYYGLLLNPNGGDVGINTSSPETALHVNLGHAAGEQHIRATQTSLANSTAGIRFGDGNWDAFIDHSHGSKDLMNFGFYRNPSRQVNMVLTHEGRVGIGNTTPIALLDIKNGRSGTSPNHNMAFYVTTDIAAFGPGPEIRHSNQSQGIGFGYSTIYATGYNPNQEINIISRGTSYTYIKNYSAYSDDRIKTNEEYITNATETLLKLKPQIYDRHEKINEICDDPTREAGLIAQDVYYDAPELRYLVSARNDGIDDEPVNIPEEKPFVDDDPTKDPDYSGWGNASAGIAYIQLVPYLIKAVQEIHQTHQTTKTELKADLSETKADLSETKSELKANLQSTQTELSDAKTDLQVEKEKTKTLESRLAFLETAVASLIS